MGVPSRVRGLSGGKKYLIRKDVVVSRGPSTQLSSRTSRTSGHKRYRVVLVVSGRKRCRVDKEYCRVEKCISLGRLEHYFNDVVVSRGPSNQLSSRTSRTSGYKRSRVLRIVRVDTSVVESTKNIVEWTNASY